METATMGRVLVQAKFENNNDREKVFEGRLTADEVRTIEVDDALVDSGASTIGMPGSMIQQLGLRLIGTKRARTASGSFEQKVYTAVHVTIQGQSGLFDVFELPEGSPVLIGQLPLEYMDWVIDMKNHRLIPNPAHGGEHMFEFY